MVYEAIDHTDQKHTMLSPNQLRHHGVDICDVHPKFTSGGNKGKFRNKVGDHELPLRMEIGLATLTFRRSTDEELENCEDVISLISLARWDPANITDNNFLPGADHDSIDRLP